MGWEAACVGSGDHDSLGLACDRDALVNGRRVQSDLQLLSRLCTAYLDACPVGLERWLLAEDGVPAGSDTRERELATATC